MTRKTVAVSAINHLDPSLLFQRLVTIGGRCSVLDHELLSYELCSYSPALFESSDIPRKANKPELANALRTMCGLLSLGSRQADNVKFTLDGGALLHRLPWKIGSTYTALFHLHCDYVHAHYSDVIVVFDGYPNILPLQILHIQDGVM